MELRDKYIHAISRPEEKHYAEKKEDDAMLEDMKFALEFLKFSGRKEASPRDVVALAKVAEFYRKHYGKKPAAKTKDEMPERVREEAAEEKMTEGEE